MTIERSTRSTRVESALSIAWAASVGAAGLYAGATDSLGKAALGALVAMLAVAWILVPRIGDGAHSRCIAVALAGLAMLAFLQTVPLPQSVGRVIAPYAFASRDATATVEDGVRASLDVDLTRHLAMLLLAFAVLVPVIGTRISAGAAPALARSLALVAITHVVIAIATGRYGQQETTIFGGFEVANPFQAYGSFPNRYQFSGFEIVLVGAGLWLLAGDRRPIVDRLIGFVAVAGAVVGVYRSGSRAGLLGVCLACSLAFVFSPRRGRRGRRALAIAVLLAIGLGARAVGVSPLVDALPVRGDEATRLDIWRGTLALSLRQPWVGIGFGALPYAYAGEGREPTERFVSSAENDLLETAAESGLVGLAIVTFAGLTLVRGLRARTQVASESARRSARLALCGPIGLLPLSMTSIPLHTPAVAIGAISALALVVALLRDGDESDGSSYS